VTSRTPLRGPSLDRRRLVGGFASLALLTAGARSARSEDPQAPSPGTEAAPPLPTPQYLEAFDAVVGSGTPREELLTLELPDDAENGNIVPYKIGVESPMTSEDYIAEVHLLSTQNPQPRVAVFHFTPLSGKAAVSGRMRLAKTQVVVAVAVTSTNKLLIGRRTISVGIGGCGTE